MLLAYSVNNSVQAKTMEIPLYQGKAPGSENWTWKEGMNNRNSVGVMTVYNVIRPTLTVISPDAESANGTAIIVCPGGGFHFLAIDHEGSNIALELVKKGITVFILKYRLVHILTENPFDDMLQAKDKKAWDDESLPVIPLAMADARHAIAYTRSSAAEYKINPGRIGIMGFSAGGMLAAACAFDYTPANRPDFVAAVYADFPATRIGKVRQDAPPLYLACAQDDEFGFVSHALSLYDKWYTSQRPVELHLFTKGGHGFGVGDPSNTTHKWIDQFGDWLTAQYLMNLTKPK